MESEEAVSRIRRAIQARGEYLCFIHRELAKDFGASQAETVLRRALRSYGRNLGKRMGRLDMPEQFVCKMETGNPAGVFKRSFPERGEESLMSIGHCPLVESWKSLGCSPEEIRLLCSIAMEGDFGIFDGQRTQMSLESSIGEGSECCRMRVRKRKE